MRDDKTTSSGPSRRRFYRARIPLLVQYRFSPSEPYTTDYSADLSRGGMFIRTTQPYPIGTLMDLQFVSRDGERVIQGRGRIVRVRNDADESGQAIEFIDFLKEDTDFLTEMVKQHMGRQAQNRLRVGRKSSRTGLQKIEHPKAAQPDQGTSK